MTPGNESVQSNAKRRTVSASASFAKLRRCSADDSARPPTAGAASAPNARLLFAMINATTLSTAEIGAIVVVVLTTIAVATTAAPPTEHQSATVANARLGMGITIATINLERGNPRLAANKTARARAPRTKCTATRVARQNMSGPNARRARPIKRSRQQSVRKHTMLTTSVTLQVTPQASASTPRRWQATNPAKGTVVARITLTTKTTLPLPSRPRLASKLSAMHYLSIAMSELDEDIDDDGNNG